MDQYMLLFSDGPQRAPMMEYFKKRCKEAHFTVEESGESEGMLLVEAAQLDLEVEATHMKLRKTLKDGNGEQEFEVESRGDFEGVESEDFFLPCEKMHMTGFLLNALQVDDSFLELLRKPGQSPQVDHRLHAEGNLILSAKQLGFLEDMSPVHNKRNLKRIWNASLWSILPPVQEIRDYFGEGVGFYWAWMTFYTLFLIAPALVGLAMYIVNRLEGWTVDNSPYVPFFALFIVLWGAIFMKYWKRQCTEWAHKWDTLDKATKETIRPGFQGQIVTSPITGKPELYYPSRYRMLKYIASSIVTGMIISIAFFLMIMSLNLQGYVQPETTLFYFPVLSQFSRPGAIFDPLTANMIVGLIPTVIHVAVIQTLNMVFRRIALHLTDWENHKTEESYENSLILKRFIFEAFDSYIALFYLAFYERDVLKVRKELVSLYTVDCIRRLATECLLPVLLQVVSGRKIQDELKNLKAADGEKPSNLNALEDSKKDPYEEFDDYLEMVIEFGYVTMFASAFPLASFLQILYNLIEMKSDAFKLCFVCQRPPVARESGIKSWETVLSVQVTLSLFTNVALFAFSSDQMVQWFPSFFRMEDVDNDGDMDAVIEAGKSWQVFLIIFVLEHILGLCAYIISKCIPDTPKNVHIALKKQEYQRQQEVSKMRKQKRSQMKTSAAEVQPK